jgi:hypothetical protein
MSTRWYVHRALTERRAHPETEGHKPMTRDPNMLTDAELDAVVGGLDIGGAINTAIGPVTVTPSPK